jgi:hypothetical protein
MMPGVSEGLVTLQAQHVPLGDLMRLGYELGDYHHWNDRGIRRHKRHDCFRYACHFNAAENRRA